MNLLGRFAINRVKGGTQDFVTAGQFDQCLFEGCDIERTGDSKRRRQIVRGAGRFKFVQKPEPFLGKRERQRVFSRSAGQHYLADLLTTAGLAKPGRINHRCKPGQRWKFKKLPEGNFDRKRISHP